MMTHRERILAAIRGEIPDRLPWVPRLEFWYRARLRHGTLLAQIADRLGVGFYDSIPDWTNIIGETDMIDRTLGLYNLPVLPYRITLEDDDRRVSQHGRETVVEYHTPVGSIRTASMFTEEMLDAGASTAWISQHAIRAPQDFEVVGHIFSHLKVEPRMEGYLARRAEVGEQGLAVGFLQGAAGPIQLIMKELMQLEQFFYALHDYPEKVHRLAEQIEPYYKLSSRNTSSRACTILQWSCIAGANS
jgi:hypothetical protein